MKKKSIKEHFTSNFHEPTSLPHKKSTLRRFPCIRYPINNPAPLPLVPYLAILLKTSSQDSLRDTQRMGIKGALLPTMKRIPHWEKSSVHRVYKFRCPIMRGLSTGTLIAMPLFPQLHHFLGPIYGKSHTSWFKSERIGCFIVFRGLGEKYFLSQVGCVNCVVLWKICEFINMYGF